MATIGCPDCGKAVSVSANACPNCGRPEPVKSIAQIESDNSSAVFGLIWFGHALIVLLWKGFWPAVAALFFGPLVWMF